MKLLLHRLYDDFRGNDKYLFLLWAIVFPYEALAEASFFGKKTSPCTGGGVYYRKNELRITTFAI